MFLTPGELGADEWRASRASDEDNAEREQRQFVWCLPVVPTRLQDTEIETHELAGRVNTLARGILPENVKYLTAAIDISKYLNYWILVAWSPGPFGHVVDYGRIEVASEDLGVEKATLVALRQFREMVGEGWPVGVAREKMMQPNMVLIDAGYMT